MDTKEKVFVALAKVNSILDYFARYIRWAELANRRAERFHFEKCWTTVFEAFHGVFTVPHYIAPVTHTPPKMETPAGPRPKWFVELYSRPMRKVIRRKKGFDVLSCGHKIESPFDGHEAKHRRCKQCKGKTEKSIKINPRKTQ